MARVDPFTVLYSKRVSALDFKWDTMVAPPLLSLISPQDIYTLNQIATSNKLASDPDEKYRRIDNVLTARGFKKIASGTNRIAYKYLNNQDLCLKVAIDRVGLKDNPAEFQNQFKLKPFVTRLFEISPCGTVALEERVEPLVNIEEFEHIIDDVFNLIVEKIIGKYVVDDIGTKYWQNFGVRRGFGPVLLDFPYVYDLDGAKIYCNKPDLITHEYCMGEIDYDDGFNTLICSKCGKRYQARQLGKKVEKREIILEKKGVMRNMSIKLMRGDEVVKEFNMGGESKTITPQYQQQTPIAKVLNKNDFYKRQEEKQKMREAHDKAVNEAIERREEKVSNKINEALPKLYESNSYTDNESDVRIIDAAQKAAEQDPNYLANSRFRRSVQQNTNKIPDEPIKKDNHMRDQMVDYANTHKKSGISLKDTHANFDKLEYNNCTEQPPLIADFENIVIQSPAKEESIEDNEMQKVVEVPVDSNTDEYVTDELSAKSSWENPLNCGTITIDIGSNDNEDDISDMY